MKDCNLASVLHVSSDTVSFVERSEAKLGDVFRKIEEVSQYHQARVLRAFSKCRVSDTHFHCSTGYGYDDQGRDMLDRLYAEVFECEDALVRHTIVSGTHALTIALFGVLRPNDTLISVTGRPYDTLEEVIGIRGENCGSLREFGVRYREIPLKNGAPDIEGIKAGVPPTTKAVLIQRSKGYDRRVSLSSEEIGELISVIKGIHPGILVIVDNCYGEFVNPAEPTKYGADLVCGSLIKNPGGGLALTGGYLAGKKECINLCAMRLTSPGLGKEVGASLGLTRSMIQGLYFAPFVVCQALKTAALCAQVFQDLGFRVDPGPQEVRNCIIQAIDFLRPEGVIAFCKGIQKGAPVDSFVTPEPWDMPGYQEPVIMAAGAFVQGASIELSADAPMKPPYTAFMQGSLSYGYGKAGLMLALDEVKNSGIL